MYLKQINHVFILIVSFLLMTGCGGSSSSDITQKGNTLLENEDIAMLIPVEELEAKSKILKSTNTIPSSSKMIVTKSLENGKKWIVYDKKPKGANISVQYDNERGTFTRVFQGEGVNNGYVLGYWAEPGPWNEKEDKIIRWKMKYAEDYYVYVLVTTPKGYRFLYYTPTNHNYGIVKYNTPHYIHHGLGSDTTEGTWKTFSRDLEKDLKDFEPDNNIITIDGFFIRGSGKVDDISLLSEKPSVIHDAIESWVEHNSKNLILPVYISKDKTRAVISDDLRQGPGDPSTKILDISNLKHIKRLAVYYESHFSFIHDVKFKEGDYIILAGSTDFLIYNYNTGEQLSQFHSHDWKKMTYLTIEKNYAIVKRNLYQEGEITTLTKIDFRDRKNPIITDLYTKKHNLSDTYVLSKDSSTVIIKDKDGKLIKEVFVGENIVIYNAIENWVDKNGNYLARPSFYLSEDKTRAVIHDEIKQGIYNVYVKILDISNLDDIKVLASDYEYRYTYTRNVKMKEGEYIILLRSNDFVIYDYVTGRLLSEYSGPWQGISYITVEDNYIILSDYYGKVVKVDFRDRENLIVTNLYQGNEESIYTLSDNGSKILVKDKDENLITKVPIP